MQTFHSTMTVRQVASDFPATKEVFRRYGEPDRDYARFGHLEPLPKFARRHNVPLPQLLNELSEASGVAVDDSRLIAERVHHPFLVAALIVTLTAGAGWGAWLLWIIGRAGDLEAARAAHVITHGEAQLWGFVVLFVIGISLRTSLHGALVGPRGLWLSRTLLALGVAGVSAGLIWSFVHETVAPLGTAGAVLLLAMALLWLATIAAAVRSQWRATWARAIIASGLWLLVWAAATVWFRTRAGAAGPALYTEAQRLLVIEFSVFGFAINAIYGFGQRLLPGLLRLGKPRGIPVEAAHWLHNAGVVAVCVATIVKGAGVMAWGGSVLMLAAAAAFIWGHRGLIGRRRGSPRAEHGHHALDAYPPLAFFWLVAGLILLSAGSTYETLTGEGPAHSYTGALRHALTVGFITTLILGVGQRLLPVLDRTVAPMPRLSVPILALIGVGNLLRVTSELAIPRTPHAFAVMPFSALLELSALALFTVAAFATMFRSRWTARVRRVSESTSMAAVLAEHPELEDRLLRRGNRYLAHVRSVPPELTIGTFARQHAADTHGLVNDINAWLSDPETCRSHTADGNTA